MFTRQMAGVFLRHHDTVLLIHRSLTKKLAPGLWSCVGGHLEPGEINDPMMACLREVREETGIEADRIQNMNLRYMTVRVTGEEMRIGYYFIADIADPPKLTQTEEGTLHWVPLDQVKPLAMSFSIQQITNHWLDNPMEKGLFLCGVNAANDHINWTRLK